jgi:hypothetical protein
MDSLPLPGYLGRRENPLDVVSFEQPHIAPSLFVGKYYSLSCEHLSEDAHGRQAAMIYSGACPIENNGFQSGAHKPIS